MSSRCKEYGVYSPNGDFISIEDKKMDVTTDFDLSRCPKCGSERGFSGPYYRILDFTLAEHGTYRNESLAYRCISCGWETQRPCKDAGEAKEKDMQ